MSRWKDWRHFRQLAGGGPVQRAEWPAAAAGETLPEPSRADTVSSGAVHGCGQAHVAGQFLPANTGQARRQGGDQGHRLQTGQADLPGADSRLGIRRARHCQVSGASASATTQSAAKAGQRHWIMSSFPRHSQPTEPKPTTHLNEQPFIGSSDCRREKNEPPYVGCYSYLRHGADAPKIFRGGVRQVGEDQRPERPGGQYWNAASRRRVVLEFTFCVPPGTS